jgi:hypothetical protein
MKTLAIVAFLILVVFACSGDDEPSYDTLGEAVLAIADAYCDRAIECGLVTPADRETCRTVFNAQVCDAVSCLDPFGGRADDVDLCIEVLDNYPCANEDLPTQCQGVVQ